MSTARPLQVVVGVLCHEAEPAVAATVGALARAGRPLVEAGHAARVVVCVNGSAPERSPAARALAALGDHVDGVPLAVLTLPVASKPAAWTRLRAEPADVTVFADADIDVGADALIALVDAVTGDEPTVLAAAGQTHVVPPTLAGRVAAVPHRLRWGGLLGTLYAARTADLPAEMPAVLLDDAWLFGSIGADRVRRVDRATASVTLAGTWRDLWRQRVRAEAGKRQLAALGVPLAAPPGDLSPTGVLRAYPVREWPLVAALFAVKVAAALRARVGRTDRWRLATSTKAATPPAGPGPG